MDDAHTSAAGPSSSSSSSLAACARRGGHAVDQLNARAQQKLLGRSHALVSEKMEGERKANGLKADGIKHGWGTKEQEEQPKEEEQQEEEQQQDNI